MRTLRSGKSLPESSLKKRRSVGPSETPSAQSQDKASSRRASVSAISQEKQPLKLIITRRMSRSQDESQVSSGVTSRRDRSSGSTLNEKSDNTSDSPGRKERSNSTSDPSTSFAAVAEKMIKKASPIKEDFQETNGSLVEKDKSHENNESESEEVMPNGAESVEKETEEGDSSEVAPPDDAPKRTPRKRREPVIYDSSTTERLVKNEICEVCGLGFTRKAALQRHSQTHVMSVPEAAPVVKKRVPKPAPSPSVSTASDGNASGIISCEVCGIFFTRKAHLDRHMKLHTGERPFECDVCFLKFTRKDHMLSHRVKHTQTEKEHPCHYCKVTFTSLQSLRDHVESEHLTDETATDQHICEICGKQFLQRRYLQAHRKLHRLRGENVPMPMGHPLLEDVEMDEDDSEGVDMQGHTSTTAKRVVSQSSSAAARGQRPMVLINKMVKLSADLALKQQAEGGEGRRSSTEDEIELQYESPMKHRTPSPARGQRRHECQVCGLCVSSIIELRKHYKIHKKRYICRFCGMRLASAGSLMRHNLLHTGKKEFGCDICGKKFSRKDTLAVHVQQHANKSPIRVNLAKPFLCKICGARCSEKFKLIRHLKITHSCAPNASNSAYQPTNSKFTTAYGEFALDGETEDDQSQGDLGYDTNDTTPSGLVKTEPIDYKRDEDDEQNWESFEAPIEESANNEDDGNISDGNADKNYQCDHCDKIFKNSKSLNTHKWYLAREKLFTCPICKRGFKYSTDLNRHVTTHSNPASKSSLMRQSGVLSTLRPKPSLLSQGQHRMPTAMPRGGINALEDRPFGCSICPQRFNHRSNLSRHMRLIHNGSAALRKRVPNSINLQNYLRKLNTLEPQKASMINQNRLQMLSSQSHSATVTYETEDPDPENQANDEHWNAGVEVSGDEPPPPPPADLNGQEVMDRAAAIAEAQRPARGSVDHSLPDGSFTYDHNSSRPYVCNPCGKSFENRSSLWTHMRIHNKSFACSFCGLKTATHGDLVLHLRTHTGERPYKCNRCEWRFSRKSALNKHFRKYHAAASGRMLRPWVYREDRGNLKFKFVRSSPQRNDFEMQHLREQLNNPSSSKMMARPLPKLTPNPNHIRPSGSGTILKSALQSQHEGESSVGYNSSMSAVFKCRRCGTIVHGKNNYIQHVRSHNAVSITPVNISSKGSSLLMNGRGDIERFSGQKSHQDYFKCTICGKVCSTVGFLSRHYQYVHPNEHNPAEEARFRSHDNDNDQTEEDEERDPLVPEVVMDADANTEEDDGNDGFGDPNIPPNTRPNYTVPLDEKDRILNRYKIDINEDDDDQDLCDGVPFPYNLAREGLEILQVISPCPRCGKEFSNKKSRSDHVWYCNRKRMFLCPVPECRKGFKLKHDISRHMRRHMDDKRFTCQACPLKFYRKMELHRHLLTAHEIDMYSFDYPCDFCDMEFKDESVYVTHLELAHSMDRNDLDGCGLDISQGSNSFGFGSVGDYEQNEDEFDDGTPDPTVFLEQSMQAAEEHQYECKPCKKIFPDRQKYMFHRYYHEREAKYPCPNCDERFKLRSHLERHIMTYHNALKPIDRIFKCEQCPRKFTREHDLVTHFNREHSNGNPMSMLKRTPTNSSKTLISKKNLSVASTSQAAQRLSPSQVAEKFNQLIEEGSKNSESPEKTKNDGFLSSRKNSPKAGGIEMGSDGMYHCDLCPKVFEEKKVADAHRYYHQREHKYSCDHCGAKFKQNSDLQRHNRIHHNPANRKRTMHCQQCMRSFTDKRYLRMHVKRYHSEPHGNAGEGLRKGIQSGTIRRPGGKPGTTASSHALNMAKLRMRNTRAYPSNHGPAAAVVSGNVNGNGVSKSVDKEEELQQKSPPSQTKVEEKDADKKSWNSKNYDADFTIEEIEIEDDEENAMVLESWGPESQSSSMQYDEDEEEITAIEEQEYMRDERNSSEGSSNDVDPLAGTEDNFEIQCQGCNGIFTNEADLDEHDCYGSTVVVQQASSGSNGSSQAFRRSMRGNPGRHPVSGVRPFFCEDCGRPFSQRIELNAHLQAIHGKAMEEYDCPFCPKKFLVKKSLDSHKRRHHGNIIQFYHCEYCGRQFTSSKFLESHVKTCGRK